MCVANIYKSTEKPQRCVWPIFTSLQRKHKDVCGQKLQVYRETTKMCVAKSYKSTEKASQAKWKN